MGFKILSPNPEVEKRIVKKCKVKSPEH